jgi:hypothetical protein
VWAVGVADRERVEIQWWFTGTDHRHQAGDRYRVTLTDRAGVQIATTEKTVASYDTYEPNGSSCSPTCYTARFQ